MYKRQKEDIAFREPDPTIIASNSTVFPPSSHTTHLKRSNHHSFKMQYTFILLAFLATGLGSASPVATPDAGESSADIFARDTTFTCGMDANVKVYTEDDIKKALTSAKKHINTPASSKYNQHDVPINAALSKIPDCKMGAGSKLKAIFEWAIAGDPTDRILFGNDGAKNFVWYMGGHYVAPFGVRHLLIEPGFLRTRRRDRVPPTPPRT
ncbi:hypothetical protein F4804DRAFT_351233 [Jackrogersella minutella]|nr:hypothetical protein F4804DRAFT_351233 [Jackrogersella minutella]